MNHFELEDAIRRVASTIGLQIDAVVRHPSGALAVYTAEGKKYVEPGDLAALTDDAHLEAAILDVLAPTSKDVVTEQERPVAAPAKGKASKKPVVKTTSAVSTTTVTLEDSAERDAIAAEMVAEAEELNAKAPK